MPLSGVLPIVHTPFGEDDSIDRDDLQRQIDWALRQGIQGYATGMVSELFRLTADERMELTADLAGMLPPAGEFIAGVGAESTRQAVELARHAEEVGATALMATPPLITSLPAGELLDYFRSLADAVRLPLVVQDASSYVGQPIPQQVSLELLQHYGADKILFKPEASPLGPNISRLRDATGGAARILEGSGGIGLIDNYRRGIAGTMPGMEFLPAIVSIWKALEAGDEDTAYRVHYPVCGLVALQMQAGLDGFLAVEKYVLHRRGLFKSTRRRRPYGWSLDEETRLEVDRLLARLDAELNDVVDP